MPTQLPGEGGGGGHSAVIIFQHQTEQLLGGSQLEAVVEVGCTSVPSDIFFQFRMGRLGYTRAAGQAYADGFGLALEDIMLDPNVTTIAYVQDVNQAGVLLDEVEVFWQSPDGSAEGSITVNLSSIDSGAVVAAVAAAMSPYLS